MKGSGQLGGDANQKSKQRSLGWSLGLLAVVVGVPVLSNPAFAGPDSAIVITVMVDNYAQVSPAILARAEREASRILSQTGLLVVWVDCLQKQSIAEPDAHCQGAPAVDSLALRLLSRPTSNRLQDSVFGFAVPPILASVYYQGAAGLAHSDDAEFELPVILGCVIVHEIGHLLLGPYSHSSSGVMQAQWGRDQMRQVMMGRLLFTHEQSMRMREEVQTRMRLQGAGTPGQRMMTVEH